MRIVYSKPATMEYEAPRPLYLDGRAFVPCNAASALWPYDEMNSAYCMPYPAMSQFPGGEGVRTTVYPSRGVIRAHRGDSPEEDWQ